MFSTTLIMIHYAYVCRASNREPPRRRVDPGSAPAAPVIFQVNHWVHSFLLNILSNTCMLYKKMISFQKQTFLVTGVSGTLICMCAYNLLALHSSFLAPWQAQLKTTEKTLSVYLKIQMWRKLHMW